MNTSRTDCHSKDNFLCYTDQGSFLGLRALGRGPVAPFTWLLAQQPDEAAVIQFNARLAQGLFARLLQRSPLPWGRHRWVRNMTLPPVMWLSHQHHGKHFHHLRMQMLDLDVDPETGPGWRLVVQPLEGGGCALSVLVSHTVADGQGIVQTIADAVAGRHLDFGYQPASWRWSPLRLLRDGTESLRELPGVGRALMALMQRQRSATPTSVHTSTGRQRGEHGASGQAVDVPFVPLVITADIFEARALELCVGVNTLSAALAVRLAHRMARVDASGRVKLVLPVSDRQPGDDRGNALRAVTLLVEPETCLANPRLLQRQVRSRLTELRRHGDELSPLLPLLPYVPLWLARHLERMALGSGLPVGFSLLGALPSELESPFGEASFLHISILERYTTAELDRLGGLLFVVCFRIGGRFFFTVSGYAPGRITVRSELTPLVQDALVDLGLRATLS
jgi:hypothetical protein